MTAERAGRATERQGHTWQAGSPSRSWRAAAAAARRRVRRRPRALPSPAATAAVKPGPVALPKEPEPGPSLPPLSYDAKGRRDPFAPIVLAKDKPMGLSITTLKLAGVIRGRTLLALVEAPDGLGYILKPGDMLGDGRVTEITQNAVTFAVAARAGQAATTATLRLAQD